MVRENKGVEGGIALLGGGQSSGTERVASRENVISSKVTGCTQRSGYDNTVSVP